MQTKGFSTEDIMRIALDLIDEKDIPQDSGIHVRGEGIRRLLFTMDANVGLIHMASDLEFDCVLCHHPCGALINQGEVYRRHLDILELHGISRQRALETIGDTLDRAVGAMKNRRMRMLYRESPNQTVLEVDAARLMGIPFLNIHNSFDEAGRRILQKKMDEALEEDPDIRLKDILEIITALPETPPAVRQNGFAPSIFMGDPESPAGKAAFVHGALSAPHPEIVQAYWKNGIKTVVVLHGSFTDLERLRNDGSGNLILTGHFLGDSIGMTPFINALRDKGMEVVCMGGIVDLGKE